MIKTKSFCHNHSASPGSDFEFLSGFGLRISGLLLLVSVFLSPRCLADPLRVTSWSFQSSTPATNRVSIPLAATSLKELDPDVILLQHVRDWQMCGELILALKPADYNVVVCSSFRDERTGLLGKKQVAILAKKRAYFSWSDNWQDQTQPKLRGGFAFAALQLAGQRVGLFSVQLETPSVSDAATPRAQSVATQQLLEQVDSVRNWVTNRVQTFVIAGGFNPLRRDLPSPKTSALRLLEDSQFFDACQQVPAGLRATLAPAPGKVGIITDYIFAELPAMVSHPIILSLSFSEHYPLTCDLELDPSRFAGAQPARAESRPPSSGLAQSDALTPVPGRSQAPAPKPSTSSLQPLKWLAGGAGAVLVLGGSIRVLSKRRARRVAPAPALLRSSFDGSNANFPSYTIVVAPRSATNSTEREPLAPLPPPPLVRLEPPGTTQTQSAAWQQRALAAEHRADQATAIVRHGLLPHLRDWLKQKLLRRLVADRSQLLQTQQAATLRALAVDERLARIEAQIQQQTRSYERRIEELTRDLLAAKEENRELIRAKISQVKAEMQAARARMLAQAKDETAE
ncbi:MAG TPA: hypothetical protein VN578_08785 [Candidatus Binatia bacterium]|nr:hypothetical protein [Candidatus Binatia bacterium]